ncbi:MAG: S8 family serine peptidase [Bacteroidetes bacterium]|nr:S8 family serine peptidase [Bacteroidota bacterium]
MKIFLLPALILCAANSFAQTVTTKFDLRFYNQLQHENLSNKLVPLLVKGDEEKIKQLAEGLGGLFKYSYNRVSSIEVPGKNLIAFSQNKDVEKIESKGAKGVFLMDTARIRNNIDSVLLGATPLSQTYKGRGVVVGIIDGGIYWPHGDFRKPNDNSTRIRFIWDQVASGSNAPLPYAYGNQWNWIDLDNGNCTHIDPQSDNGHGTCVAGIAAGNGHSMDGTVHEGEFTGVAPEADIIVVRVDETDDAFLTRVTDAVDYIFKKADALGKPCVINTSIGTYYGSHDGKDLATSLIESMLDARNGRVLVAAAGNGGDIPHHLGYNIPTDSAYTFFTYNNLANEIYFDLWADVSDFSNATFTIGCNDNNGNDLARMQYFAVPSIIFNPAPGNSVVISQNLYQGVNLLGQVSISVSLDEDRYHIEFLIHPVDITNYWRLQTSGSGKFDLWSSSALIGSADMTSTLNGGIPIQFANYRHPDYLKTMVSSWQCSDKVITVGNYSNRAGYFDRDSVYRSMIDSPYNEIVGKRFATSSFGPTRDERLKPDIMATGSTTICTGDSLFISVATNAVNRKKVSVTKKHIRNGGTSMASPLVAGIAALYLEQRPTANYSEIKTLLICTATKDSFTTAVANPEYGNGKVNAFKALTSLASCVTFGATDTACINYNPLANVDSGTCVLRVYGCTDSTADNYNPLANMSDGSCTYTGIKSLSESKVIVSVVPNPFSSQTTFFITNTDFEKATIRIFNQLGSVVDEIKIVEGKTAYTYHNEKLSKGFYQYLLTSDGKNMKVGKLVVE